VHTQATAAQHTLIKGKVTKSVTGKGASVTFYGLEDKVLDPNMSLLSRRGRKKRRSGGEADAERKRRA
jgi:hypothetical protein